MNRKLILSIFAAVMAFSTLAMASTPTFTVTLTATQTWTPTSTPTVTPTTTATRTLTPVTGTNFINQNGVTIVSASPIQVGAIVLGPSSANVTVNLYDGTTMADTYVSANLKCSFVETTATVPITKELEAIFRRGCVASTVGSGNPSVVLFTSPYR